MDALHISPAPIGPQAERDAARRVLAVLDGELLTQDSCGWRGAPPPPSEQDVASIAQEIGRLRHHAELSVMMCLHYSNAPELALELCNSEKQHAQGQSSSTEVRLEQLLQFEQERLVKECCIRFEHGSKLRGKMLRGTLQVAWVICCCVDHLP